MSEIKEILFTPEQIAGRVSELARRITREYQGQELLVVGILKGSFVFMADLVRGLELPLTLDFMVAHSYGDNTRPGQLNIVKDLETSVAGRHVLLVEDILDTGQTLFTLKKLLTEGGAASVRICAFLDKPSRRLKEISADYVGFTVPDYFVVGYGLDYAEHYRQLPYIAVLQP